MGLTETSLRYAGTTTRLAIERFSSDHEETHVTIRGRR